MNITISKQEFMAKYGYSKSKYQRRMSRLKDTAIFCEAYIRPSRQEVRINVELYEKYLKYLDYNRLLTRKVSPEEFMKNA